MPAATIKQFNLTQEKAPRIRSALFSRRIKTKLEDELCCQLNQAGTLWAGAVIHKRP
jgi:hypothetical protein